MIPFKQHSQLLEAIGSKDMPVALDVIEKYLTKKTGIKYFRYPGAESFNGSDGSGYGVRWYGSDASSFRLNFSSSTFSSSTTLSSADIWAKNGKKLHLSFSKELSLVKTLPLVAGAIRGEIRSGKTFYTQPDGVPLMESTNHTEYLIEAKGPMTADGVYDEVVKYVAASDVVKVAQLWKQFKSTGGKIFNALIETYPSMFENQGTAARAKWAWVGNTADVKKLLGDKDSILSSIGAVKVSAKTGGKENYNASAAVQELEKNRIRLTFEEQLNDMGNLLKMTLAGVSNACFIAGRGGIGKTYTTEQILAEGGLKDKDGYFKVTGGSSARGAYELLYRYNEEIVVFDDADGIFDDKDSRNLLKAATDTKKVRKLVWNKSGKNIIFPDDDPYAEMTPDEILKEGLLPKFFEFKGKIIFISNLNLDQLDPDGALRTRGFIVNIDPTDQEVYDFMRKIAPKMNLEEGLSLGLKERLEVVDMLERGSSKQSANLRKLERGLNMYAGSIKAGVSINKKEMTRMIEMYA